MAPTLPTLCRAVAPVPAPFGEICAMTGPHGIAVVLIRSRMKSALTRRSLPDTCLFWTSTLTHPSWLFLTLTTTTGPSFSPFLVFEFDSANTLAAVVTPSALGRRISDYWHSPSHSCTHSQILCLFRHPLILVSFSTFVFVAKLIHM